MIAIAHIADATLRTTQIANAVSRDNHVSATSARTTCGGLRFAVHVMPFATLRRDCVGIANLLRHAFAGSVEHFEIRQLAEVTVACATRA